MSETSVTIRIDADIEELRRKFDKMVKDGVRELSKEQIEIRVVDPTISPMIEALKAGVANAYKVGGAASLVTAPPVAAGIAGGAFLGTVLVKLDGESRMAPLDEALESFRKNQNISKDLRRDNSGSRRRFTDDQIARRIVEVERENNSLLFSLMAALDKRRASLSDMGYSFDSPSNSPQAEATFQEFLQIGDTLREIAEATDDPQTRRSIANLLKISAALTRPGALPSAEEFRSLLDRPGSRDDIGEPLTDDNIRPLSLGPTSGRGSSLWARQSASFGTSDADAAGKYVDHLSEKTEEAAQSIGKFNQQGERFEVVAGTMADRVAETNTQLGGQADLLTAVGGLLPDIGKRIIDVFTSGVAGAEDLDRAVAAMGKRFLGAFEGAIRRGESLGGVLKILGRDLANLALNEIKTNGFSIFGKLGNLFGGGATAAATTAATPSFSEAVAGSVIWTAKGNVFERGRTLTGFARGGALTNSIVNRPTLFPMASGAGLMGESGPEAVLPLHEIKTAGPFGGLFGGNACPISYRPAAA